jgi:glycerophosphoryl diester phosphodiesterase
VEIKPSPGRERETGVAVAKMVSDRCGAMQPPPLLSSFSETALEGAREAASGLPRALLLDKLPDDWLARCQRLGCVALDCNWRLLSPEIVAKAHEHSLYVLCYTCNEPEVVARLAAMGVNTIITDLVLEISP